MENNDMKYSITWHKNISIIEFTGDINIRAIELANAEWHGDSRLYKSTASIWDLTNCNTSNIKPEELMYTEVNDLGATITIKSHKLALIANNPHTIKLCETYVSNSINYDSTWEFNIFNSLEHANEWIKV